MTKTNSQQRNIKIQNGQMMVGYQVLNSFSRQIPQPSGKINPEIVTKMSNYEFLKYLNRYLQTD